MSVNHDYDFEVKKVDENNKLEMNDYKDLFMLVLNVQGAMKQNDGRKAKKRKDYQQLEKLRGKLAVEIVRQAEHSGVFVEETV
jgi:hypothetical protein